MATFVVGGIECTVDERQLALGHLVIPLADLVAFGIAREPAEVVIAYERRAPDSGYRGPREHRSGKPITTKIPAHGEVGSLVALLRERAPQAWRGEHDSAEIVLGERPPPPSPRPLPWRRIAVIASVLVVIAWVAFLLSNTSSTGAEVEHVAPPSRDAGPTTPPQR